MSNRLRFCFHFGLTTGLLPSQSGLGRLGENLGTDGFGQSLVQRSEKLLGHLLTQSLPGQALG